MPHVTSEEMSRIERNKREHARNGEFFWPFLTGLVLWIIGIIIIESCQH